ncbi:NAD(P)H-dependent oxidoreductase [Thalassolituus sp. UBA2009]|jgi:putative NADPH-quinone reductase|uniref:NAD(P)H-dependent oxidoreductase n=1 Tax=Thalassolituus sp. UBA2009 TaxID=1947658 RepID=UPI00257BC5D8|nr:NAD(P)H-dependent oxidoreductase [Thalassolituus sp. UBA2009]
MPQHILILNGHPDRNRLCGALADAYQNAAAKGAERAEIQRFDLADMQFNANLSQGYAEEAPLEPDLLSFQQALRDCDHLLLVAPVWWGSVPARLKGLFDRTLLPGFAFRYEAGQTLQEKLLRGKSAEVFLTLDTPPWYFRWFQKAPAIYQLNHATLGFCGFKPVTTTLFGPVIKSSAKQRQQWLEQAASKGRKIASESKRTAAHSM